MKDNNRKTGSHYEEIAAAFLKQRGYQILQRNFRCPFGEVDIIGRDSGYLVFIEVKYRKTSKMGSPAEAVTPFKQHKIHQVARYYLMKEGISEDAKIRFDAVGILGDQVVLYQDAF